MMEQDDEISDEEARNEVRPTSLTSKSVEEQIKKSSEKKLSKVSKKLKVFI